MAHGMADRDTLLVVGLTRAGFIPGEPLGDALYPIPKFHPGAVWLPSNAHRAQSHADLQERSTNKNRPRHIRPRAG